MKCLQKYSNNAIDVYSYCYENVVNCVLAFSFTNLCFFFCFKEELIVRRKKKWKEEFYEMHQEICLKSSNQAFNSSLDIKSIYQIFRLSLLIKSLH